MRASETTKPATVSAVNGLRNVDHARQPIDAKDSLTARRAQRLAGRFGLMPATAATVGALAFGEVS